MVATHMEIGEYGEMSWKKWLMKFMKNYPKSGKIKLFLQMS